MPEIRSGNVLHSREAVKTEILTQHTHYGGYWFFLIFGGVMALLFASMVIGLIVDAIKGEAGGDSIVGVVVCAIITAGLLWILVYTIAQGPETTYKAKITDFNVVYEKGYEIIEKDGELYTIRESEAVN
jgi:vacuolar-type H+-ATPase subunit I/STV1